MKTGWDLRWTHVAMMALGLFTLLFLYKQGDVSLRGAIVGIVFNVIALIMQGIRRTLPKKEEK